MNQPLLPLTSIYTPSPFTSAHSSQNFFLRGCYFKTISQKRKRNDTFLFQIFIPNIKYVRIIFYLFYLFYLYRIFYPFYLCHLFFFSFFFCLYRPFYLYFYLLILFLLIFLFFFP